MSAERILIVEDEEPIAKLVEEALRRCGYRTEIAEDGDSALEKSWETIPDLIILDLMLPRLDGWEVCRRLREDKKTKGIPIIMLTARRGEREIVAGLELGADDYMEKPFSIAELTARVKVQLRKRGTGSDTQGRSLAIGPLRVETESGEAFLRESPLDLSPIEYQLLEVLALSKGRLVSRDELLSKVWGFTAGDSRTVDVHVFRLRRKIEEDPEKPQLLHTVRGRGYRLLFKGDVSE